jgi:hypothetical protein
MSIAFPPTPPPRPSTLSAASAKVWDLRDSLIACIGTKNLNWVSADLDVPSKSGAPVTYKIEVCSPVCVTATHAKGTAGTTYYVPVTARETYELAKYFDVFPLTQAVADLIYNKTPNRFSRPTALTQATGWQLYDFPTASTYYMLQYNPLQGKAQVSGGHKLWILSSVDIWVNHGMYTTPASPSTHINSGYLNNKYAPIQLLGKFHTSQSKGEHWDYSQLLQLMRNLTDAAGNPLKDKNGNDLKLIQALQDQHPAVWDEPKPRGGVPGRECTQRQRSLVQLTEAIGFAHASSVRCP